MGTLTSGVISTTYKNLVFQKDDNNLYYTNSSDVDTPITTFTSALTLSGLITASAGIKLGNNIVYNSDAEACLTLDADQGVSLTAAKVLYVDSIAEKTGANGVSIDSVLLKDGNVKLGASNTIQDSNGGNAIVLDTSSNVTVLGDLTVTGNDISYGAATAATLKMLAASGTNTVGGALTISAGQGTGSGAGGSIVFQVADGGGSGSSANTLATAVTIADDKNVTFAGNITLTGGGNITTALQCDSTLGVTGITTLANNLVFTGAQDITWPDASGLEMKTTDAGGDSYITFTANAIAIGQPMTCSGKVLLSGNTGPTAGTGITAASGEVYNSWVERYGNMIKTSIYIDINSLQANGDQKVIGKDGGTANCHLGQITTALNGAIIGGRMTCLEQPATGDRDIDLCFDDASDGAEAADLTGETDLVERAGDWTTSEMRTFGTVVTANNYLYLRTGTNASDNTYSAGKFLIELWGTV